MNQAALLRAEQATDQVLFFSKNLKFVFFCHGQVQVEAQTGFKAQPGLQ